jgi:uncharacterized protein YciI
MYVLTLTYLVDLDRVDEVRDAHMAWIAEQYEAGRFLVSGPKVPRDGGVVLARQMDRDELDEVIASDPFTREGVAAYDVTEFRAMTVAEGLQVLKERG